MKIIAIKSVAIIVDREVPITADKGDIVVEFTQKLRTAAIEITRKLARKYRRRDIEIEVY